VRAAGRRATYTVRVLRGKLETPAPRNRIPDAHAEALLDKTIELASRNTGTRLCLALSYGGRAELVDAARKLAEMAQAGDLKPEEIDESMITGALYQPGMPELDLVIRTAGEMRLSNFLLWQVSYAEFYVTDTLWPDFREEHLHAAIEDFRHRERRFGGLNQQAKPRSAAG
jgi:undecaprenyl diphosphate synthase